jgi:hypothetical protein
MVSDARGAACRDVVGVVVRNVRGGDAVLRLLGLLDVRGVVVGHPGVHHAVDVLRAVVQTDAVVGRQRTAQIEKT